MSQQNYFVLWKGVKSGPYTQEALEKEFSEGRLGLMRTVIHDEVSMTARDFVINLETRKREEDLEDQIREREADARRIKERLEQQQAEHDIALEKASKRSPELKGGPPPIPDINPWDPGSTINESRQRLANQEIAQSGFRRAVSDPAKSNQSNDKYLIIVGYISSFMALLFGLYFRELFGLLGVIIGAALIVRKQITQGSIILILSICFYGAGRILTEFIHDYIIKNYPH